MKIIRVCVTGPECTGKTTLVRALAGHYGTAWVGEYARCHAEACNNQLSVHTVQPIACGQLAAEERALDAIRSGGLRALLMLDTDLVSTVIYSIYYYGSCPGWIEHAARDRAADLYLLSQIDVPWRPDGIRDLPHARQALYDRFKQLLNDWKLPHIEVAGSARKRLATAVQGVDRLLAIPKQIEQS